MQQSLPIPLPHLLLPSHPHSQGFTHSHPLLVPSHLHLHLHFSEWAVEPLAGQKALSHTDPDEGCVAAGVNQQSQQKKQKQQQSFRSLQGSNNSIPRCEEGRGGSGGVVNQTIPEHAPPPSPLSLPTSPARPSNPMPNSLLQPLHTRLNQKIKAGEIIWHQTVLIFRSASQPVRSCSPPPSPSSLHHYRSSSPPPPAPSGGGDGAELRQPLSRNPNSRSSMPSGELFSRIALSPHILSTVCICDHSGKPPLPLPLLPKSPTDLSLHRVNNLPTTHSRLQVLL